MNKTVERLKTRYTIRKHWCGCTTESYKDGVRFIKKCDKHEKDGGYIWIALQHPLSVTPTAARKPRQSVSVCRQTTHSKKASKTIQLP